MANREADKARMPARSATSGQRQQWEPKPWPNFPPNLSEASFNRHTNEGLEAWIQWCYCTRAFTPDGNWLGFKWLTQDLIKRKNDARISNTSIKNTVQILRRDTQRKYAFPLMLENRSEPMTKAVQLAKSAEAASAGNVAASPSQTGTIVSRTTKTNRPQVAHTLGGLNIGDQCLVINETPAATAVPINFNQLCSASVSKDVINGTIFNDAGTVRGGNLLDRQLAQMEYERNFTGRHHGNHKDFTVNNPSSLSGSGFAAPSSSSSYLEPNFDGMDFLMTGNNATVDGNENYHSGLKQAPLLDESIVRDTTTRSELPQFGLLGTYHENVDNARSRLFLNTNAPFSAFVCGVQGSGKSHTTSCIMENCLVPTDDLGVLRKPLSALVFSYGSFTGDGLGFNISEAAFLGASNPKFGIAHVKKINVLVCETNFAKMRAIYERLPNVKVTCFKLDPKNLDIDLMLKLMNVDESGRVPLYMAQILRILRHMAMQGVAFDYKTFKQHVNNERFEAVQRNMLDMRLDLLESFLDLKGLYKDDMLYEPGEITIMDMSCPFVDINTACLMFNCGLQRYMQSKASGKLVVLDEAHKYMLDVPAAKLLNATLIHTIRMQRHSGTRVVISTQEPTLLSDLIALCSIAVIHKFSSPEWFGAIKKHIFIPEQYKTSLMERIEGLSRGTAIVYSPNSVLGYENGLMKKGNGMLMEVNVRQRITTDGGRDLSAF